MQLIVFNKSWLLSGCFHHFVVSSFSLYVVAVAYTFDSSSVSFSFAILFVISFAILFVISFAISFSLSSRSHSGHWVVVIYTFYRYLFSNDRSISVFAFVVDQSSFLFSAFVAIVADLFISMFIIFVEYIVLFTFNQRICHFPCPKGQLLLGLTRSPLTLYFKIHTTFCLCPWIIWGRHYILLRVCIHTCN